MEQTIIQQIVNVLGISGVYMTFAMGMTLIYAVMRVFHIAHGSVFVIGAYSNLYLFLITRNIIASAILSSFIAAAAGILIQTFIYTPILKKRLANWGLISLIASVGTYIATEEGFLRFLGAKHREYPIPFNSFTIDIFGAKVFTILLTAIILAVIIILSLWAFLMKTRTGKAMRAVAQDWELASCQGINPYKIFYIAMFIGSIFAGLAGSLTSLYYNDVYPAIGFLPVVVAFAITILGGLGSFIGTVIGALIIGAADTLSFVYLPIAAVPRGAISFVILLFILAIKPEGIFGRKWK